MLEHSPIPAVDVAIIGGGPAGCAAGLTLLKKGGISVAVLEADDYNQHRIGESLSPGCRALLDYLQAWPEFSQMNSLNTYSSNAAWGSEQAHSLDYLFTLHGSGWQLDRRAFDQMLSQQFQRQGGELISDFRVQQLERHADYWQLQNKQQSLLASYVIDASGRNSNIARKLGGQRVKCDQLTGVAVVADVLNADDASVLVEACEYGWWYSAILPGNKLVMVLMADADTISQQNLAQTDNWQQALAHMPLTSQRSQSANNFSSPKSWPAFSSYLKTPYGDQWLAVGDAAASYDPLSSSGIPHALGSGVRGALAAMAQLEGQHPEKLDLYQQTLIAEYQQYFNTRGDYYRRVNRWPESRFWQRRQAHIELAAEQALQLVPSADESYPDTFLDQNRSQELIAPLEHKPQMSAVELVRTFQQSRPAESEQNIILALQQLLQGGVISAA